MKRLYTKKNIPILTPVLFQANKYFGIVKPYNKASTTLCKGFLTPNVRLNCYSPPFYLLKHPRMYKGFINGFRQPVSLLVFQIALVSELALKRLENRLTHYLKPYGLPINRMHSSRDVVHQFASILYAFQKIAGLPLFDNFSIRFSQEQPIACQILMPKSHHYSLLPAIDLLLKLFNIALIGNERATPITFKRHIKNTINDLSRYAPNGSNSLRFLKAAYEAHIPWKQLTNSTYQFGYAHLSRWLNSTFTDKTPYLSTNIASNKYQCAQLLKQGGLPVPTHHVVSSVNQASAIAKILEFPVVIKPLNQEGGNGVTANIRSFQQLNKAYLHAIQFSKRIIVEKHVTGKDYRLQVMHGEVIWAIERKVASIIGDGYSTIRALIPSLNQQRIQNSTLKPIAITDDITLHLNEQGVNLNSIPQLGQKITLSTISNVSKGGAPISVFDKVHPDNKRLATLASDMLRLDIAGVDMILPDIEQSYLKRGGVIIEVNAQPQLGNTTAPHLYQDILLKLLPSKGRIPIILIIDNTYSEEHLRPIQHLLSSTYHHVGLARNNQAYINNTKISESPSLFQAGESLLLNPRVDAIIYYVTEENDLLKHGLPFDYYDWLIYIHQPMPSSNVFSYNELPIMEHILQTCEGNIIVFESALDSFQTLSNNVKKSTVIGLKNTSFGDKSNLHGIDKLASLDKHNKLTLIALSEKKTHALRHVDNTVFETFLMSLLRIHTHNIQPDTGHTDRT